jgi:hypothetical protein
MGNSHTKSRSVGGSKSKEEAKAEKDPIQYPVPSMKYSLPGNAEAVITAPPPPNYYHQTTHATVYAAVAASAGPTTLAPPPAYSQPKHEEAKLYPKSHTYNYPRRSDETVTKKYTYDNSSASSRPSSSSSSSNTNTVSTTTGAAAAASASSETSNVSDTSQLKVANHKLIITMYTKINSVIKIDTNSLFDVDISTSDFSKVELSILYEILTRKNIYDIINNDGNDVCFTHMACIIYKSMSVNTIRRAIKDMIYGHFVKIEFGDSNIKCIVRDELKKMTIPTKSLGKFYAAKILAILSRPEIYEMNKHKDVNHFNCVHMQLEYATKVELCKKIKNLMPDINRYFGDSVIHSHGFKYIK